MKSDVHVALGPIATKVRRPDCLRAVSNADHGLRP
jgi:hypothetical protein